MQLCDWCSAHPSFSQRKTSALLTVVKWICESSAITTNGYLFNGSKCRTFMQLYCLWLVFSLFCNRKRVSFAILCRILSNYSLLLNSYSYPRKLVRYVFFKGVMAKIVSYPGLMVFLVFLKKTKNQWFFKKKTQKNRVFLVFMGFYCFLWVWHLIQAFGY